jgi:uncharacterized protein (TIGR00369 family)
VTEIWQEPVRGRGADPSVMALPGLEQLRTFCDGRSADPPVARLTGRRLLEADEGRVVYGLPVTGWLVGPKGTLHPGVLAFLADAPLLAAVVSTLGPATPLTTAEVSMTFLGTAALGDELRAEGRVIHVDRSTGLAEVRVTRGDGRLLAHGTTRDSIFAPLDLDGVEPTFAPFEEPEHDQPDPYLREAEGGTLAGETITAASGLELLQRQVAGELPRPPIDRLTGMRLTAAGEGTVTFTMPAGGWATNEFGTVYGGLLALLAASAGSAAVQTTAPVGTPFAALDMKINVLRPVMPDGSELTATATVVHGGRSLAIANTEIVDATGARVALATGTTALGKAAALRTAESGLQYE